MEFFRVPSGGVETKVHRATTAGTFFIDTDEFGVLRHFREFPSIVARELDVVNYGGAVAFRSGIVSVGGGVHASQLSFESALVGFDVPPDFFGPATYDQPIFENLQVGDDWGVGFAAGVLVVPNDKVQIGASYRRGASFEFEGNLDYPDFPAFSGPYDGPFKVPDNFGAGVAVRPLEGLTVALDLNRVFYSDLEEFIQSQVLFDDPANYTIDDATEIHIGAEYVLTGVGLLPALRAGFWRETAHEVNYAGEDSLYNATAPPPKDINHVSFGAGIAPSRRIEINAGFDFSDRGRTMSFSGIFRF